MTDKEFNEYIKGNPTITGIVAHMKTWWSNEGTDKEIQDLFDLIIELDNYGFSSKEEADLWMNSKSVGKEEI